MRREVCYTFRRMVSIRLKRLYALKEGFNVRNGNGRKAFGDRRGNRFPAQTVNRWLMEALFSALFHCPESVRD